MAKNNTNHKNKQTTSAAAILLRESRLQRRKEVRRLGMAAELLRADHGAMTRIAHRLGVNRSTVSRVVRGQKTSERVRLAIMRECLRISKLHASAGALIEIEAEAGRN
jgi:DNA-binding transcriptional regulator LsrR (DeoR family)